MGGGVDTRPGIVILLVRAAVEERAVPLEPVLHACQYSTAQHSTAHSLFRVVVQVSIFCSLITEWFSRRTDYRYRIHIHIYTAKFAARSFTVPVMHVEIQNSDFLHSVFLLRMLGSDAGIVQETEPTRFVHLSVMARWTHTAKCRAARGRNKLI
jgi:hypothetical protein